MGLLASVVLLILGFLSTEETLSRYRPELRTWARLLSPFQGYLGVGMVLYGLYLTIRMVAYLPFIRFEPVVYVAGLLSGVCAICLGLIFGHETARKWAAGHVPERSLELCRRAAEGLTPYRSSLGYAALLLGAFGILLNIFV
jgi:hypothetical protein